MLAPRLDCPWALQGGRMTKADLVEKVTAQIARTAGPLISKKDCARVVDSFLDAVKAALAEQHNIEVRGFGTFKIRQRKTRMARNPRTGDPVEVAARPFARVEYRELRRAGCSAWSRWLGREDAERAAVALDSFGRRHIARRRRQCRPRHGRFGFRRRSHRSLPRPRRLGLRTIPRHQA